MSDLINRQDAIDVLDKIFPTNPMRNNYTQGIACGAALATVYIKQLPSAQPEPKRGRWKIIDDTEFRVPGWYCSLCNYQISDRYGKYYYCPSCGAKMEEEE